MIRFLVKGILNDKSRSLLPVIIISIGVALTVTLDCWLKGVLGESVTMNANFNTGHLKVMTKAYAQNEAQMPNDLALTGSDSLLNRLRTEFPETEWVQRIRFGCLIDFPDSAGETRAQGPVTGWAVDLLTHASGEPQRFNISESLVKGRIPVKPGEALITDDFAQKFKVSPGDVFTLFGTTMDGGMAFKNFKVSGTVRFGSTVLDRGAVIIDITDARKAFGMEDAAGEILGYFRTGRYDNDEATRIQNTFISEQKDTGDFAPLMLRLKDQGGMAEFMDYSDMVGTIFIFVFVLAMSVVLWNTGLLGGLRRYNEFGVRLALGEEKKHIYLTLIYEGILIGITGSITGTALGISVSFFLQEVGLNVGGIMKNSSLMMPSVVRAAVNPAAFYIGFIPGLLSMVFGNALSGIGIYKRNTAQLFKELEV